MAPVAPRGHLEALGSTWEASEGTWGHLGVPGGTWGYLKTILDFGVVLQAHLLSAISVMETLGRCGK